MAGPTDYVWRGGVPSGITWPDLSTNHNDATLLPNSGGVWTGGTIGAGKWPGKNCPSYNGTSGYATLANTVLPSVSIGYTLMSWIKSSASFPSIEYIVSSGGSGGESPEMFLNGGQICIYGSGYHYGSAVTLNSWHHLALTYDGATVRTYLDGVADVYYVTPRVNPTTAYFIGKSRSSAIYAIGAFADHRIYPRALSQAEIQACMLPDANLADAMHLRRMMGQ